MKLRPETPSVPASAEGEIPIGPPPKNPAASARQSAEVERLKNKPAATSGRPVVIPGARLTSLDAFRGFIMIVLAANGFGLAQVARNFPDSAWTTIAEQFQHAPWIGVRFWDLIMPAFMFMVGASLPYSYARRRERGDPWFRLFLHALMRSLVLIALGVFLTSKSANQTVFSFMNVLTQIGLGYIFVFLLWNRGWIVQAFAAAAILGGWWYAFYQYPAPEPGADPTAFTAQYEFPVDPATKEPVEPLTGLAAKWNPNTNFAAAQDQMILNWFPQPKPFVYNQGQYQTLNFVPEIVTMLFGLMVGELLRRPNRTESQKLLRMLMGGAVCILIGLILGFTVCPIVKRIWTPSFTLVSGGACIWMLAAFYAVIDMRGWKRWAFPLVVVGMNSIVMYLMSQLMAGWITQMVHTHFAWMIHRWLPGVVESFNPNYLPIVNSLSALAVMWLICYWLYRQRLFVRI